MEVGIKLLGVVFRKSLILCKEDHYLPYLEFFVGCI